MNGPAAALLPGGRLHLQHGPIDLVIGAEGERDKAFRQAIHRFQTVLSGLTEELAALRRPEAQSFNGPVAQRMAAAVAPHKEFVTPMAAVAGAVADEVLAAMVVGRRLWKAYVNNGGDVALHLTAGAEMVAAAPGGQVVLCSDDRARGIATSGWRGRSHSLGIADAVTVLAHNAAAADVAATLIANAVDLPGDPRIRRQPATVLAPESDLGSRLVTVDVPTLAAADVETALHRGYRKALAMQRVGLIESAQLLLQGRTVVLEDMKELTHA